MKRLCCLFISIFILNVAYSQDWEWLNPIPQGNSLLSVCFPDTGTGYATGFYGTILKTTDDILYISELGDRNTELLIYPNPTSNEFFINTYDLISRNYMEVLNIYGQVV